MLPISGSRNMRMVDITDATLPLLGVKPTLGRLFTRGEDSPNGPKTVIISYGYWQRKLGGNRQVIGRALRLNGVPHEIIGVLPQSFHFLDSHPDFDLYTPMHWDRRTTKLDADFSYRAIARLKPGVTLARVNAEMDHLHPITLHSFPSSDVFSLNVWEKLEMHGNAHELKKDVVGDVGKTPWVVMGPMGVLLLIACANVANLLLVRVEGRRQELAVCSALGAGRGRIASELFSESIMLGIGGMMIGLGLAFTVLRVLTVTPPVGLEGLSEIGINLPVLLFTFAVTLFVSIVVGMIPVIRFAGQNVQGALREGGRALSQGREHHRVRKTLVVVQVALALVLLICSGLMTRTFRALTHVNPGFTAPESLETFRIAIPEVRVPETNRPGVVHLQQQIAERLAEIPGVASVSFCSTVPLDGAKPDSMIYVRDSTYREGELPLVRRQKFIAPGFFKTMGTPIIAGRDLTWDDIYRERPFIIVSENLAKEYWHNPASALDKEMRAGPTDDWRTIIGVVGDVQEDGMAKEPPSLVYSPILRTNFLGNKEVVNRNVAFAVRSSRAGSSAFLNEVQRAVWSVDSNLPLAYATTIGEEYTRSMARTSSTLVMLSVAGGMALLLGILGIYGVISYAVSQRTREIGIRMAMGAQRDQITLLFVRQGLALAAVGVVLGIAASVATMRLMSSLLFNVSPVDPITYALATAGIVMIAWVACYLPSRRAATVDPVQPSSALASTSANCGRTRRVGSSSSAVSANRPAPWGIVSRLLRTIRAGTTMSRTVL
jgi:predicted permease